LAFDGLKKYFLYFFGLWIFMWFLSLFVQIKGQKLSIYYALILLLLSIFRFPIFDVSDPSATRTDFANFAKFFFAFFTISQH